MPETGNESVSRFANPTPPREGRPNLPSFKGGQSATAGTMYDLSDPRSESLFMELEAQLDEAGMFKCVVA